MDINELKNGLQDTVSAKMKEATENLVTKDKVAEINEAILKQNEAIDKTIAENETLKAQLTEKTEQITMLSEDLDIVKNEQKVLKSVNTPNNTFKSFVDTATDEIMNVIKNGKSSLGSKKIVVKSAGVCHTTADLGTGEQTFFSTMLEGVAGPRRYSYEWLNDFAPSPVQTSASESSYYYSKLAIKDTNPPIAKVNECTIKPNVKFDIQLWTDKLCKIAGTTCFSEEWNLTAGKIRAEILNVFRNKILAGIPYEFISQISLQTTTSTPTAVPADNLFEAYQNIMCYLKKTFKCVPTHILMSESSAKKLERVKDGNGNYLFKCCSDSEPNMRFISGARVTIVDHLQNDDDVIFIDSSVVDLKINDGATVREITGEISSEHNEIKFLSEVWVGAFIHPCSRECAYKTTCTDIQAFYSV